MTIAHDNKDAGDGDLKKQKNKAMCRET